MRMLEDKIRAEGRAINADVLLVDSFLNHQVDVQLMKAIGEALRRTLKERASPALSQWKAPVLRPLR